MVNVLVLPTSGIIEFNSSGAGTSGLAPDLNNAVRLDLENSSVVVLSGTSTSLDRFVIAGTNGSSTIFSDSSAVTGTGTSLKTNTASATNISGVSAYFTHISATNYYNSPAGGGAYLPLSGGTVTGAVNFSAATRVVDLSATSSLGVTISGTSAIVSSVSALSSISGPSGFIRTLSANNVHVSGTINNQPSATNIDVFNYKKPDGSNLLRSVWDSSNFHHYVGGTLYYNLTGNAFRFDGNNDANSQVALTGKASLRFDPDIAAGSFGIRSGDGSYATTGTPLTKNHLALISTWAWNGTNGFSVRSDFSIRQEQNTSANGDATLSFHHNTDNVVVLAMNGSTKNVGVGTSSPTQKLHVSGNALISSSLSATTSVSSAAISGVSARFTDLSSTSSLAVTISGTSVSAVSARATDLSSTSSLAVTISGTSGLVSGLSALSAVSAPSAFIQNISTTTWTATNLSGTTTQGVTLSGTSGIASGLSALSAVSAPSAFILNISATNISALTNVSSAAISGVSARFTDLSSTSALSTRVSATSATVSGLSALSAVSAPSAFAPTISATNISAATNVSSAAISGVSARFTDLSATSALSPTISGTNISALTNLRGGNISGTSVSAVSARATDLSSTSSLAVTISGTSGLVSGLSALSAVSAPSAFVQNISATNISALTNVSSAAISGVSARFTDLSSTSALSTRVSATSATVSGLSALSAVSAPSAFAGTVSATNFINVKESKSISIISPGSTENITLFNADAGYTITEMVAVLRGSATPSITWTVRKNGDRSAVGTEVVTGGTTTTSTTTGSVVTTFNSATIAASDFVWLAITAKSGTVTEYHLTVHMVKTS